MVCGVFRDVFPFSHFWPAPLTLEPDCTVWWFPNSLIIMLTKKTVTPDEVMDSFVHVKRKTDIFLRLSISLILSHEDCLCTYCPGPWRCGSLSLPTKGNQGSPSMMPVVETFKEMSLSYGWYVLSVYFWRKKRKGSQDTKSVFTWFEEN